ncbi:hypothetical protein J6590_072361 [Homalodisca vitripennis]|nr:hypothetical protein J6590_072361 [Homalodisca vitripennis]
MFGFNGSRAWLAALSVVSRDWFWVVGECVAIPVWAASWRRFKIVEFEIDIGENLHNDQHPQRRLERLAQLIYREVTETLNPTGENNECLLSLKFEIYIGENLHNDQHPQRRLERLAQQIYREVTETLNPTGENKEHPSVDSFLEEVDFAKFEIDIGENLHNDQLYQQRLERLAQKIYKEVSETLNPTGENKEKIYLHEDTCLADLNNTLQMYFRMHQHPSVDSFLEEVEFAKFEIDIGENLHDDQLYQQRLERLAQKIYKEVSETLNPTGENKEVLCVFWFVGFCVLCVCGFGGWFVFVWVVVGFLGCWCDERLNL